MRWVKFAVVAGDRHSTAQLLEELLEIRGGREVDINFGANRLIIWLNFFADRM